MFLISRAGSSRRRGAVAVFALVFIVVLIGFASLTLDVGAMYNTRADLQNAADAGALSGASMLASNAMLQARIEQQQSVQDVVDTVYYRATEVSQKLRSFGAEGTMLDASDVITGWIDLDSATSAIDFTKPASQFNAIQVSARRSKDNANGPLTFFFASVFGQSQTEVSASATAAFDDRVAGYDPATGNAGLMPFTINVDEYNNQLALFSDQYEYDSDGEMVASGSDGVPEVDIYPSVLAPGNFGLLNISNNNGTQDLSDYIQFGIPPEDLEDEIGSPSLVFYDDEGAVISYIVPGNPGLKAALEPAIESKIGDIVAILVHSAANKNGANTVYTIVGVRFVRVMDVSLQSRNKVLWMQPVSYTGPGVIINPAAPSSSGVAGQIQLVR